MLRNFALLVVLVFFLKPGFTQDISFSQKYVASPYLNPALTGIFNGSVRVTAQYRDQWRSPLDYAFQTYAASADLNYKLQLFDKTSNDLLGVGIVFINDRIEGIDFNTSAISLNGSFQKSLNLRYQHYIGIGFQVGVIQKNINYEQLRFQDQFNNIDNFSFPTAEPLPTNNFAVGDFGLGIIYLIAPNKRYAIRAGLAYTHFSTPNISFFRFDNDYPKNSIYSKITLHSSASIKTGAFTHVIPRMIISSQGPFADLELGSTVKFTTFDRDFINFHLGLGVNVARDNKAVALTKIVPFVGFQLNNILIGLSYDVGINQLIQNNRNFSTLEFSISYLGEYDNQPLFCPKF